MKKLLWILLLVSLVVTACSAGTQQSTPTPLPEEVDWPTAVNLLKTGEVDQIFQLHNLTVTLYFKDGQQVKTIEPTIDAIFTEVQNCGAPCSNIILATE
ncbi:MAG: hypothetical protein P8Y72_15775 [Anaerolineales bacterium]|jgi:hypothetical protein